MLDYQPVDYKAWNFDGQGKNIINKLLPIERNIWNSALPYQDSREGETGHAEFVVYFALRLNEILKGNREITVPAVILHDVGWSQLTETERKLFYETEIDSTSGKPVWERYEPILRARHQEQGSELAKKILIETGYTSENSKDILEIISQHDTRKGFLNTNDGIVRDADKLWQFTLPHWKIFIERRNFNIKSLHELLVYRISKGFFSDFSNKIARIELKNSMNLYDNH